MKITPPTIIVGVMSTLVVQAQDNPESLQTAANDPTASIISFQLQGFIRSTCGNSPEDSDMPLGVKVSKLVRRNGLPWHWTLSYEHNID